MNVNHFVDVGHLEDLLNMPTGTDHAQGSPGIFQQAGRHDKNSDAGAVDHGNAAQIKDDFLVIVFNEAVRRPFQLLAITSDGDFPGHLQHGDAGLDILGLNLQHKEALLILRGLTETTEHDYILIVVTSTGDGDLFSVARPGVSGDL